MLLTLWVSRSGKVGGWGHVEQGTLSTRALISTLSDALGSALLIILFSEIGLIFVFQMFHVTPR